VTGQNCWQVTGQLLSAGGSVHIARKRDWTALLAAADSGTVVVFGEFLKQRACVVISIKKCSELLKAAAARGHIDVFRELLEIGAGVEISRNMFERLSS
jgi:ankyrin repeat protein